MGKLIEGRVLRRVAAERGLGLDLIETDYALGWMLKGVSSTSVSGDLVFKGGTALSKVYYPLNWRLSEDLDFTLLGGSMEGVSAKLKEELPGIVEEQSGGIRPRLRDPYVKPDFLRVTVSFNGPITQHRTRIEVTRERFIGDFGRLMAPDSYDCPTFSLLVYTLENILAEKLRSLIERTRIRDYYDSWRLLSMNVVDEGLVKGLFLEKCRGKEISFSGGDQLFPGDLLSMLEPPLDDLTRITVEPLPLLKDMIRELRDQLEHILR